MKNYKKPSVIAKSTGVCTKTLRRMADAGHFSVFKVNSRVIRYDEDEVFAFIRSKAETGKSDRSRECQRKQDETTFPVGTEARICELVRQRQIHGFKKYGTLVRDNPLTLREWLTHALEEALDMAIYLKRSIEEMDKSGK